MKHPDRQRVFDAMDLLNQAEWADLIQQIEPIVNGQALVLDSPAVERLRAVVQAEHDKD